MQAGTFTKEKFEKLGEPGSVGWSRLWRGFWAQADEVRGHYLWRGGSSRGRPVFSTPKGASVPAVLAAWVFHLRELRAGEEPRPKCGQKLCIRPDHQAVEVVQGGR